MVSGLIQSLTAYFKALRMIPKFNLWKHLFLPCLIGILLAVTLGFSIYAFGDNFGELLTDWIPLSSGESWWANSWNVFANSVKSVAGWMGSIFLLALTIIVYKTIFLVVVGPFLSPLTEKLESGLTGEKTSSPPFITSFFRGLRLALRNIFRELILVAILFILGLFPLFSIPAAVLIFLVQAYYSGAGNLDFTLERHLNRKESIRFIKNNRMLAIGNGAIFLLLLGLGIGFIIAPPLAAIAGTINIVDLLEKE